MLEHTQVEVSTRTERGKNAARRLRVTGQVPATVYGLGKDPDSISLNTRSMVAILNDTSDRNRVFDLTGGSEGPTMAVAWQSDPVTGKLLHVDLRRVDPTKMVRVKVAVKPTGEAYGVKTEGGLIDAIVREAEVDCLPDDVPASIDVDITELETGQSIRVRDLEAGEKYSIASKGDLTLLRLVGKRTEEEDEADEAAAAVAGEEAATAAEGEGDGDDS